MTVPACVLLTKRDILGSARAVYRSGGTIQGKDLEITAEQIQRELGLGVRA